MRGLQFLLVFILLVASGPSCAACDDDSTPGDFPFSNEQAVSLFLTKLQLSVSKRDIQVVADLVQFPLRVILNGKAVRLNRESFAPHFDEVFNRKVLASISAAHFQTQADYRCVFWNRHGMMLGRGEVWFESVRAGIKVVTVNNQ